MSNIKVEKFELKPEHGEIIKNELQRRWNEIEDIPGIFSYRLNITKEKYLQGDYNFYCQLNTERTTLRRKPQSVETVQPKFDETKFNFNKIKLEEKLIELELQLAKDNEVENVTEKFDFHKTTKTITITLIINNSPLTRYHLLICPQIKDNLPQILTKDSIISSIRFLQILNDKNFRIIYNSAGALASVNHLHFHLIHLPSVNLYVESIDLEPIENENCLNIFQIHRKHSIRAICFIVDSIDNDKNLIDKLFSLIENLCKNEIAHNLFLTLTDEFGTDGTRKLKVFLYVRENICIIKDYSTLHIASCEFSGYISVGSEKLYDELNETFIVETVQKTVGNIFPKVLEMLKNILM